MLAVIALLVMLFLAAGLEFVPGCGRELTTEPAMRLMIAILCIALLGPGIILLGENILSSHAVGLLGMFHKIAAIALVVTLLWVLFVDRARKTGLFWVGCAGICFMAATGGVLLFSDSINMRQISFTMHDMGAILLSALALGALVFRIFRILRHERK